MIVDVEVNLVTHRVPVARGGDAAAQGRYFCGVNGIDDEGCAEGVAGLIIDKWSEL